MRLNAGLVEKTITGLPFLQLVHCSENSDHFIKGVVKISDEEMIDNLDFEFVISPTYPLKVYDSESIKFINKDLMRYQHVMKDGSICIHSTHNVDPVKKLISDFISLKNWITRYYNNNSQDMPYEHLVVPESVCHDKYWSYIFSEVDHTFRKGDFGLVDLTSMTPSSYKGKGVDNFLVQAFYVPPDKKVVCQWSPAYLTPTPDEYGHYLFLKDQPLKENGLLYDSWDNFRNDVPQDFIEYLHQLEKQNKKKFKGKLVPIFIGYQIAETSIHWQVALLEIGKFPIHGERERKNGIKTENWLGILDPAEINWAITRDASYKFYFGRGALKTKLTNSKILIVGIGAVGSVLAKALTKGGCRRIDLADHDIKNPENVCRSEYFFTTGLGDKTYELTNILYTVSPFIRTSVFNNTCFQDFIKYFYDREPELESELCDILNTYDIIFDCTTDDDLMFVLDSLQLECDVINLSITNHAKHLICGFYPNIYNFVRTQVEEILDQDTQDVYEPIGCWNPTFKASYTDINLAVQIAVKQIDTIYSNGTSKKNFVVNTHGNNGKCIHLQEF